MEIKVNNLESEITNKFLEQIHKKQEELFVYALRNVVEPPIKGEITANKIRWRGVKLVHKNQLGKSESWLEQRGKRKSEVISFETINNNNNFLWK